MNETGETPALLKELHCDLRRKYQLHGSRIEQIWLSLDQSQRDKAVKAGAAGGHVLADPTDRTMGNVYKVTPEWNLRDLTQPESDYLLNHLKHRATKSLSDQYREGVHGSLGDHAFILESMRVNHLRHTDPFRHCFTLFIDEDKYGQSFKVADSAKYREVMAGLSTAVNAGLCVPQSTGELILQRQMYLLQALNILVEDILEKGSTSRQKTTTRPKKPEEAARAALSTLSIDPKPEKISLEGLLARALDQKTALEDYVTLCRTEPVFLAHVVNGWFFTRPELVPDEKGRRIPLVTDKYISIAIFEVIHNAVIGAAIWGYVYRLLQALATESNDRLCQGIILQEMANVCHFEHRRVQKLFKRYVQMGSGSKYFKRVSGVYDEGTARVTMKIKPDVLTRENPQLHYVLRLCQTQMGVTWAVEWIKKLDDLHQSQPTEREHMGERELDAFGDLAVTTSFVQSLSISLPLPPINPRKGQTYVSRLKSLGTEIDPLKTEVNLAEFAVPIDNLLEPGMADGALIALDRFIVDRTGTELGFLYQDLNEDCLSNIQNQCREQKAKIAAAETMKDFHLPITDIPSPAERVEQRRQKHKTRPAHSSIYSISPAAATTAEPENTEISPILKVKPDTFKVFSTLFSRSQSRGSISWAAFEAAMTDLKFSVTPKLGSVYTFSPPQDFSVPRPLTLHRPHQSQIEGFRLLYIAKRLKRAFGWGEELFEVA
ncbi:uncharacterized protein CDV56_100351 [Aspergillus thermomutatus]|uniref:Ipa protein n=1 Tax=Aspergillus thermomutatus TaxID=41047 RepID=A0A397FY75_ASPTH|nr:uncharacterized protein CDV56_100351 [Aspergillus thermomutatus]RHZ43625.1 hypothetical protein CDV56_100351 [Aspergillus thermomutatus]